MIELKVKEKPKEIKHPEIGKTVIVFDRYHFAVPLRGRIQDVSDKDGAYKVSFYNKQYGYPNYLKMDYRYFFAQQCQIEEDQSELEGIWVGDMKDGDIGVIVEWGKADAYIGRIVQRHGNDLISIGMKKECDWILEFGSLVCNLSFHCRVRLLKKGEELVVV